MSAVKCYEFCENDLFDDISKSGEAKTEFDKLYEDHWTSAYSKDSVFRYKLNINEKIVPGKFNFVLQLNLDRATNRRVAVDIQDVKQQFNPNKFNFNKIHNEEMLFEIKNTAITSQFRNIIAVNVSPICRGHVLLCPNVDENLPQIATLQSLELICNVMFLSSNINLRAGFNSLCARASVNHLHYHLLLFEHRLLIETIGGNRLRGHLYELVNYPAKGFCFQIKLKSDIRTICGDLFKITNYLIDNGVAHNLYLTKGVDLDGFNLRVLRIVLWVRTSSYGAKDVSGYNLAAYEFSGHFPIKNLESYQMLTEDYIVETFEETIDPVFNSVRDKLIELF